MKIKNKEEKQITCTLFRNIEAGMCFYDEYRRTVMMKLNKDNCAVNIETGVIINYEPIAYLPLVEAEVVWGFKKEWKSWHEKDNEEGED